MHPQAVLWQCLPSPDLSYNLSDARLITIARGQPQSTALLACHHIVAGGYGAVSASPARSRMLCH